MLSGKGGVGKSTVTAHLALSLASNPSCEVGVLDIDLCGPTLPRMLGVMDEEVHASNSGWSPISCSDNVCLMSAAALLPDENSALIWRGPKKHALIKQFLMEVDWEALDFLLIDTPPGTSDEHLSIVSLLKGVMDGAILVTSPQEMSLLDVRKEISFCRKVGLPILGVIENMSSAVCHGCGSSIPVFFPNTGGAEALCKELNLPYWGSLPLNEDISLQSDKGLDPDTFAASAGGKFFESTIMPAFMKAVGE